MAEKADVSYRFSRSLRPSVNVPRAVCDRKRVEIVLERVLLYKPKINSPTAGKRFTSLNELYFFSEKLLVASITCLAYLAALASSPIE